MLEDFRLKVFVTVVKERSFTKAAYFLGVTQPAVSQNVAELEKGLGVKLFERLKGDVVLTEEGKVFKRYADRMLHMAALTYDTFSRLPQTSVRISVSEEVYAYLVGPALEAFSQIHPEVRFERVIYGDADLKISVRPDEGAPFDYDPDVVAKLRVSMSKAAAEIPEASAAAHEKTSCFELVYHPSASFACTRLCRLLKEFMVF